VAVALAALWMMFSVSSPAMDWCTSCVRRIGRSIDDCTSMSDGRERYTSTLVVVPFAVTLSNCSKKASTLRPCWSSQSSGARLLVPGTLPSGVLVNDLNCVLVVVLSLSSSTQICTAVRPWLTGASCAAVAADAIDMLLPASVVRKPCALTYSRSSNLLLVTVIFGCGVTAVVSAPLAVR